MKTALPITWLTPIAVRSHFPSSRRSVSGGTGADTTDAGTVAFVMRVPSQAAAWAEAVADLLSVHRPVRRLDIRRHPLLVRPVSILRHAQLPFDLVEGLAFAHH